MSIFNVVEPIRTVPNGCAQNTVLTQPNSLQK